MNNGTWVFIIHSSFYIIHSLESHATKRSTQTYRVIFWLCRIDGGFDRNLYGLFAGGQLDWKPEFLSANQANTVAEMAETILPKTKTPGAKNWAYHSL